MHTTKLEQRFNVILKAKSAILFLAALLTTGIAHAEPLMPSCKFPRALCGYVDDSGKVVIPPQFDTAGKFVEARARVSVGGQYGIIDNSGVFVVPPDYQAVSDFWNGLAQLHKDGVTTLVDHDGYEIFRAEGEIIIPTDANHFLIGRRRYESSVLGLGFRNGLKEYGLVNFLNQYWSMFDRSTGRKSEPVVSDVRFLSDQPNSPFWQKLDGEYFLTNTDGSRLTEGLDYGGYLSNGTIPIRRDDWSALINLQGEVVQEKLFEEADFFYDDRWTTFRKNLDGVDRFGYIDQSGEIVIPAQFEKAGQFEGDVAKVTLNGWDIQIDRAGKPVAGCLDDIVVKEIEDDYFIVRLDGTTVTNQPFAYATASCQQPTRVYTHDDKAGFVTSDGELLGKRHYRNASAFYDGVAAVWLEDNQFGIIDTSGAFIVPPLSLKAKVITNIDYVVINPGPDHKKLTRALADQLARDPSLLTTAPPTPPSRPHCRDDSIDILTENGLMSYWDVTGAQFIERQFDFATCFRNGYAQVAIPERREWCDIDKRGLVRESTCNCHQPLIIFEFDTGPKMTSEDVDCYAFGLRIVREYSSKSTR